MGSPNETRTSDDSATDTASIFGMISDNVSTRRKKVCKLNFVCSKKIKWSINDLPPFITKYVVQALMYTVREARVFLL